ncbi:MAG: antitoxin family protein [Desulfobacterales bacterium]|nr:antitoxin family protein [Desulfobacterales bacterium]
MSQNIMAIYEHGVLRPLEPLILPESQTVWIQVIQESLIDNTKQVIQYLNKIGLLIPPSSPSKTPLISKVERRRLSDALSQKTNRSLSEIVIDERGQW